MRIPKRDRSAVSVRIRSTFYEGEEIGKADLDNVNADLSNTEAEEARLLKAISDRKSARLSYNTLQLRKLESDLAPLQQHLYQLQVKKGVLMQRRATIEAELKALQ